MSYITWLIVLMMLAWFFDNYLADRSDPQRLTSFTTSQEGFPVVTLKRDRSGHYRAAGSINGVAVIFMIDTGASDLSIPESVALEAGLKRGAARRYQTANGTITAYRTQVKEVVLGNIQLRNIVASINPEMEGSQILLGMSVLRHLDFGQRENILTLKPIR